MTSQSPRIYTYKITFEEVPYYYYGVHKEKVFGEEYWGSPRTNRWCWNFYTPKKQILEIFQYTNEGWIKAQEIESRLIKQFFNDDKWCLNESCGGKFSLKILSENGKKGGAISGKINGKISGQKSKENKTGIFGFNKEQLSFCGKKSYELGLGVHGLTKDQRIENGSRGGTKSYELGLGVHALTKKQKSEIGRKTASQKWQCTKTGFVANAGNLTRYQRKRGIDTSNRKRIS